MYQFLRRYVAPQVNLMKKAPLKADGRNLAQELGFADAYSFSKTFKRIMGQSPSAMR